MSRGRDRTPGTADLLQVQRYVDGELSPEASRALAGRLRDEPSLQVALEAARAQRRLFADDPAAELPAKPLVEVESILEHVRRLPSREELVGLVENEELSEVVAATGRRWLVAAALLLTATVLFGARLIRPSGGEAYAQEAAELRQLDEIYRKLQEQGKGLGHRRGSGSGR